jgi:4'-phosphopantetheinyl transferase EntD
MARRDSSNADSAPGADCKVAALNSCELQDRDYTDHLSVDEGMKYRALPSQTRKNEWLAGRLAAKYIFLNWLEAPVKQAKRWGPSLSQLSPDSLVHYPSWMYQQVEVATAGAQPSLVWCGEMRSESISLSHSGGMSCACLTFRTPTAIDIENTAPRLGAFHRINFSEAERRWAINVPRVRSEWFFTFLWTLKESVLKLGCLAQASIWNLPQIEIENLPDVNDIEPLSHGNALRNEFAVFNLTVKQQTRVISVQVAVNGTRSLVLTVVNPVTGVIK